MPVKLSVITRRKVARMPEKENMFKEGDWVHTEDGIGIITKVFPHYYQYWEKEMEERERKETYGDGRQLADKLYGKIKEVGDWVKDIIYVKRLCNHDLKPFSRTKCFSTQAAANDKITQKEMKAINKILQDPKIAQKFQKYKCEYDQHRHVWGVLVPAAKAAEIKSALDKLEGNSNGSLTMTMREIEAYFKESFNIDVFESLKKKTFNNATIHTLALPEDDVQHYNANKEQVFCKIMISKQAYDEDYLPKLIKSQKLDPSYYDNAVWERAGWDGVELAY